MVQVIEASTLGTKEGTIMGILDALVTGATNTIGAVVTGGRNSSSGSSNGSSGGNSGGNSNSGGSRK